MVSEAIDFKFLLLENYKKLKLSENEVMVILMIDHLLTDGNSFITADLLSLKMNIEVKKIDDILASLMSKKYLEFTTKGKKTGTTLEPLKKKLFNDFQLSLRKEAEEESSDEIINEFQNVYSKFEELFGRTLSPVEISKLHEWISYGYSDDMIINALKDSINQGKKSIRSVDKILLSYQIRDDIECEGHTPINKNWNRNLEETIKIAKTPWIDDNDK